MRGLRVKWLVVFAVVATASLTATPSLAVVTELVPWSLDSGGLSGGGLTATATLSMERVRISGRRRSQTPWGLGAVNYVAGATVYAYGRSPGTLDVDLIPAGPNNTYGSGSGFKSYVQFWNDPANYVAIGLIYDPAASPMCAAGGRGVTLMIEGSSSLVSPGPIGGYWNNVCLSGAGHHFKFQWTANTISVTLDDPDNSPNPQPLVYPITMNAPSITFMGGARLPGDSVTVLFQNIVFSASAVPDPPFPVTVPSGPPYVRFRAPIQVTGTGSGYNAYAHISDVSTTTTTASGNAMSVGIQADTGDPNSLGAPFFTLQRVIDGAFDFRMVKPADNNPHVIELAWWASPVSVAVFYADGVPIASFGMPLTPRLIFAVDAGARLNGDSVSADFTSAGSQIGVTAKFPTSANPACVPGNCGLNGSWNTTPSQVCPTGSCFGLTAIQLNPPAQQAGMFTIGGTVSGIPPGGDWHSHPVYAPAVIAQLWFGQ
ncbi:MAG: hypothetical protein GEU82_12520 [Luteitalea sp.]|nr:hypothetical protein [Luteitalea sp.]